MRVDRPIALIALATVVSCRSSGGSDKTDAGAAAAMTRAAVVAALGRCTVPVYQAFATAADELATATAASAADPTPATRDASRAAWRKAMSAWQHAEQFQYGPAGAGGVSGTPGGQGLRDHIYAWPLVSRCGIEERLVDMRYAAPAFANELVDVRGLAAAEYLLFHEGTENTCGPTRDINAKGTWAALAADGAQLDRRRRAYAAAVAADVRARAATLVAAWQPDGGNFLAAVTGTARGGSVYKSAQTALEALNDALFYVEHTVKDAKLAGPLGLKMECAAPPCPDLLESRFAGHSLQNLRANLAAFQTLAFGCPEGGGLGFDDLLVAVGHAEVAHDFEMRVAAAQTALAGIPDDGSPDPLRAALTANAASVRALYDALRSIVELMKTDVTTLLELRLPTKVATDNDT